MNMNKLLVTIFASSFTLCSAVSFAASTLKLEELTTEQRTDMRSRADQLTADRAATGSQTKSVAHQPLKVQKPHAEKIKPATRS
jgi:hypothetical protein